MSASQSDVRPSLADYWRGLKVQARVLNALMIRELMMRSKRSATRSSTAERGAVSDREWRRPKVRWGQSRQRRLEIARGEAPP
jgi:hypothetical protein